MVGSQEGLSQEQCEALTFFFDNAKADRNTLSMEAFRNAIGSSRGLLTDFEKKMKAEIVSKVSGKLSSEEYSDYGKDWKTFRGYMKYCFRNGAGDELLAESYWPYYMAFNDWMSPNPFAAYHGEMSDYVIRVLDSVYSESRNTYQSERNSSRSSSSSSCSSCSSCSSSSSSSSCSSCGGGGAD